MWHVLVPISRKRQKRFRCNLTPWLTPFLKICCNMKANAEGPRNPSSWEGATQSILRERCWALVSFVAEAFLCEVLLRTFGCSWAELSDQFGFQQVGSTGLKRPKTAQRLSARLGERCCGVLSLSHPRSIAQPDVMRTRLPTGVHVCADDF